MSAIDNFITNMSKSGGYARSAQYELILNLPDGMVNASQRSHQLTLNCDTLTWPGHDLQTQSRKHGNEPERYLVKSHGFEGTITASFYLSLNHSERFLLEQWQELAVNRFTHKANYYNEYTGSAEMYQLGSAPATRTFYNRKLEGPRNSEVTISVAGKEKTNIAVRTYGIEVQDVYPSTIALTEMSYALPNEIQRLTVTFQYRQHLPINLNDGNKRPLGL
jgi:hypothetical protein|tara:strand:+ start:51 stop:710 length:660 start_codon:yes stop_codon:yes gene_type:complete